MVDDKEARNSAAKMNVIISLLMDIKESLGTPASIKDKVEYLARRGISNKEIAQMLNISENHVSKEKSVVMKNG